jgi:hypothetical protein
MKRGTRFLHARILDASKMPEKVPQVCVVTRVARGTVYYRPDYGLLDDGSPWLGSPGSFPVGNTDRWVSEILPNPLKSSPSRADKVVMNDSSKAGQLASRKETFGDHSRFAVAPVHTRFDRVSWFVWDANLVDDVTGGPSVIRQAETREDAVAGF